MSMLRTDYKNDVYDGKRKYEMLNNSDGTVSLDDVTKYTAVGDVFGADDINDTNAAVNRLHRDVVVSVPASFSTTAPYILDVNVAGIKVDDPATMWSAVDENTSAADEKTWNKMLSFVSYVDIIQDGKIRIVCKSKRPTAAFKFVLRGISG